MSGFTKKMQGMVVAPRHEKVHFGQPGHGGHGGGLDGAIQHGSADLMHMGENRGDTKTSYVPDGGTQLFKFEGKDGVLGVMSLAYSIRSTDYLIPGDPTSGTTGRLCNINGADPHGVKLCYDPILSTTSDVEVQQKATVRYAQKSGAIAMMRAHDWSDDQLEHFGLDHCFLPDADSEKAVMDINNLDNLVNTDSRLMSSVGYRGGFMMANQAWVPSSGSDSDKHWLKLNTTDARYAFDTSAVPGLSALDLTATYEFYDCYIKWERIQPIEKAPTTALEVMSSGSPHVAFQWNTEWGQMKGFTATGALQEISLPEELKTDLIGVGVAFVTQEQLDSHGPTFNLDKQGIKWKKIAFDFSSNSTEEMSFDTYHQQRRRVRPSLPHANNATARNYGEQGRIAWLHAGTRGGRFPLADVEDSLDPAFAFGSTIIKAKVQMPAELIGEQIYMFAVSHRLEKISQKKQGDSDVRHVVRETVV